MINEIADAYQQLEDAQRSQDAVAATAAYQRLGELIQTATIDPQLPAIAGIPDIDPESQKSIGEQRESILQALYDAAESGNVPAALKWLELHANIPDQPPVEAEPEKGKKRRRKTRTKKTKKAREEKITIREGRFVEFYFGESAYNGTDAARKAGYKGNDNVLAVTAHQILKRPKIQKLIQARLDQVAMPVEQVLRLLGEQARGSIEFFLDMEAGESPTLSLKRARDEGKLHLIKGISFHENNTVKSIQWYSAQDALKTLGNFHRLFQPKKPAADAGDTPEEAARNYESAREDARSAINRLRERFPELSESDAARRAVKFFPAAKEWIAGEPEPTPAVN